MSKQKFSPAQREAIWKAHDGKCAYTRTLIDVSSFHIDHIVPEGLADDPQAFAEARATLKLPDDFDLFGYNNLQKSSQIFDEQRAQYFLAIASGKRPKIEENLQRIERRLARGKGIILLQQCLDRGDLTPDQVSTFLRETPDQVFALLESLSFVDMEEITRIKNADIDTLRDLPVKLGENDDITGLTLTSDSGYQCEVRSCREYDIAISKGYYPQTTFDIKMSAWFEHQSGLLKALQAASFPLESYISDPRAGIIDLDLMPFSMFPRMEEPEDGHQSNETYQDKVDDGTLVVKRIRHNMLRVVRADFDGDGIEDILLFEYCYATRGTMGFGGIRVVTRLSYAGRFLAIESRLVEP